MTQYFIIPGLGNSVEEHWQTYFEQSGPAFQRIRQMEWDAPVCHDWVASIEVAIQGYDLADVVLIGHSLGCATIAHWAGISGKKIKGALLVAPSDLEAQGYDFQAVGFAPIPARPLPFRSIVVASANDPWVTLDRARFFAGNWGSEFMNIGQAGHINTAAGFGPWPKGLDILASIG